MVGRHSDWAEVCMKIYMDQFEKKILAVVGTEQCENHCHRKGKGSLTMQISQGLIGPNLIPNRKKRKGKQVKIPVLLKYTWQHKVHY